MFTYTTTISRTLAPAGLILSQLTSRLEWNFTYNKVSDRATTELKASQPTSCNHRLSDYYYFFLAIAVGIVS